MFLPEPHWEVATWLAGTPHGRIRGLVSNGLETRLLYTLKPTTPTTASNASSISFWRATRGTLANANDERRCNDQRNLVDEMLQSADAQFVGHVAADCGMGDAVFVFVPAAHSDRVVSCCQPTSEGVQGGVEPVRECLTVNSTHANWGGGNRWIIRKRDSLVRLI